LIIKVIAQYLFIFITSCNVLNFSEGEVTTNLKLESDEISNLRDIEATFTVRNGTDETKKYSFSSGCQSAFKVLKEGVEVFNSIQNIGCTQATSSLKLQKRESKTVAIPKYLDEELEPDKYIFKAFLIGYEQEVSASKKFFIVSN